MFMLATLCKKYLIKLDYNVGVYFINTTFVIILIYYFIIYYEQRNCKIL